MSNNDGEAVLMSHFMKTNGHAIKKTIAKVIDNRMTRKQAARTLRVSPRTIHNYVRKYLDQGPDGLLDHRRGHFRKIDPELEGRIVALRLDRPTYSARWLRDRMKLNVSVEAVRQVLLKYRLNRRNLGPRSKLSTSSGWDPF